MSASGRLAMCCITSKGNHSLTFGGDALHNYDLINNRTRAMGYITYSYLGNYMTDLYNKGKAHDTCNSTALRDGDGDNERGRHGPLLLFAGAGIRASPEFAISTLDYSFFAQDNWKVNAAADVGARRAV